MIFSKENVKNNKLYTDKNNYKHLEVSGNNEKLNKIEIGLNSLADDELLMQQFFGFSEFQTTKNKSHVDSDCYGVFMPSKLVKNYRQYINKKRRTFNVPSSNSNGNVN